MAFTVTSVYGLVSAKLGRCARCIRLSLRGAVLGWGVLGVTHLMLPGSYVEYAILLWPVSFTSLWFLHITAYGARRAVALREGNLASTGATAAAGVGDAGGHPPMSRRGFLITFAQGATLAVLASLAFPRRASADCPSGSTPCGNTGYCCDSGWYYCGYDECEQRSNRCVPPTAEGLKRGQQCCAVFISCG